jgi:large subunit ribosomal protein L6
MSRVGKAPISIPKGVTVEVAPGLVKVSGPQGNLESAVNEGISVVADDGVVNVTRADDTRQQRALHGLTRSLVNNMVEGVSNGYSKELNIIGVGYRVAAKGKSELELALGFSHAVHVSAPDGVTFECPDATTIKVSGIDKQLVGQVAANIRELKSLNLIKAKASVTLANM